MISYLNPYRPIISSKVDVHQYSSTINDGGNSTTSDDTQRYSGYQNPYQPLALDTQEKKQIYNELKKKQDIETLPNTSTKDREEEIDCKDECTKEKI